MNQKEQQRADAIVEIFNNATERRFDFSQREDCDWGEAEAGEDNNHTQKNPKKA